MIYSMYIIHSGISITRIVSEGEREGDSSYRKYFIIQNKDFIS